MVQGTQSRHEDSHLIQFILLCKLSRFGRGTVGNVHSKVIHQHMVVKIYTSFYYTIFTMIHANTVEELDLVITVVHEVWIEDRIKRRPPKHAVGLDVKPRDEVS